jgi:hypothetical protein
MSWSFVIEDNVWLKELGSDEAIVTVDVDVQLVSDSIAKIIKARIITRFISYSPYPY